MRRPADGKARRTLNPPMSRERGTMTSSSPGQRGVAAPGSTDGCQLILASQKNGHESRLSSEARRTH
jgi:hypothetical protein